MKKVILLFTIMLALAVYTEAQTLISTTNLRSGVTYAEVTTDVQLDTANAKYWLINAPQDWYTTQYVTIALDSVGGDHTNVAVDLWGRVSDLETWTQIGTTVNWKGTTADTVIVISNTTENAYRLYKVLFTGTGNGSTKIDNREFKQHYGLP